ncbi:MAG: hypothetical protein M1823_001867 [Watsoniomyces obsoletus]|nr:MAG: hypothetical protein M1823_001867 [Watsoniomyces obsoletus]
MEKFASYNPQQNEEIWRFITANLIACVCPPQKLLHEQVTKKMEEERVTNDPTKMQKVAFHHTVFRRYEGCLARREWLITLARRGVIHRIDEIEQGKAPTDVPIPPRPDEYSPTSPTFGDMIHRGRNVGRISPSTGRQMAAQNFNSLLVNCVCPGWLRIQELGRQVRRLNDVYHECLPDHSWRLARNGRRGFVEGNYDGRPLNDAEEEEVKQLQEGVNRRVGEARPEKPAGPDAGGVVSWVKDAADGVMPKLQSAKEKIVSALQSAKDNIFSGLQSAKENFLPALANLGRTVTGKPSFKGVPLKPAL